MTVVTRIAPSPTGLFHLGTARTAYINYLMAKANDGKFILRIDDTDTERNKDEYITIIRDSLDWLGLKYDEIHFQSDRKYLYLKTARELVEAKLAYYEYNGAVILDKIPYLLRNSSFHDTIAGEIPITDTNREQANGKLVLLRGNDKNNSPTYQFASIVDDYFLGITNIIRGVDHITNTPKQIAIWNALTEIDKTLDESRGITHPKPKFTHLGLIFKDKKKLSKRDGAASLLEYQNLGYKPEAMLNWMLLLGWSLRVPRGNKELEKIANSPINKEQAVKLFNEGQLKNSSCNFSLEKLDSLNKYYSKI